MPGSRWVRLRVERTDGWTGSGPSKGATVWLGRWTIRLFTRRKWMPYAHRYLNVFVCGVGPLGINIWPPQWQPPTPDSQSVGG